jgi:methionine-rich copper-binding protein CopC
MFLISRAFKKASRWKPVAKHRSLLALTLLFLLLFVVPAAAHGELEGSDPEEGATLQAPPPEVTIELTETPTNADELEVLDGCGRNVIEKAKVVDKNLVASLQEAQPGAWLARWRVQSDEDGHVTEGSISFRVQGKPDCSAGTKPQAEEPSTDDSSSVSPTLILSIVVGTGVLIGIAFLVRRTS